MASFFEEIQLGVDNYWNEGLREIIRKCCRKDKKSQEILYKQFYGYALSIALIYNKQRDDAIDIVNDSFMKVFAEISKFDPEKPFKIWLRKIVINSSIDQFRRRKRNSFYDESSSVLVPDQNPTVISSLTAGEVLRLLNQLPDIQKMVFSLYEMEGFSHEEIGSMLNIPVSSSRVYLTRAKKKLRKLFPLYFDIYDAGLGKR